MLQSNERIFTTFKTTGVPTITIEYDIVYKLCSYMYFIMLADTPACSSDTIVIVACSTE